MQLHILATSASAYRRWWYVEQLRLYGMEVFTAIDGLDCITQMRSLQPDIVILEPSLLWGGSQGVLALRLKTLISKASQLFWWLETGYPLSGITWLNTRCRDCSFVDHPVKSWRRRLLQQPEN